MSTAGTPLPGASKRLIFVLILVSAINPIAINMFVPAIPEITRSLRTDVASVQMVLSAYLFSTAAAQVLIGPLSDRFGRRPLLIGGLTIFAVASTLAALAPSIGALIGGRILQGAGGCAGIVLSRAIVRDLYERNRAAAMLGYVSMGFAVAPMMSPTIGGFLNDLVGWRSIFVLQCAFGIVGLLATLLIVPETRPRPTGDAPRPGYIPSIRTLSRIPAFWGYVLNLAFGVAVFFSFLTGGPVIAAELLGLSGTEFGLYFTCVPCGYILGNFLTARFSQRFGIAFMTVCGSTIAVGGVALMAMAFGLGWHHPLWLFVPMSIGGLANGIAFTNAIAGAVSLRPELAGAASGLAGALQTTGGAVASVVVGLLFTFSHSVFVMLACMAVFAVASLTAALWTRSARNA